MNQLTILTKGNQQVVDSREAAEMVGKSHSDLMKSIRTYSNHISNQGEISLVDFFIESSYQDNKGEVRPCYLLTKKGCDMVANKMTGEKGVLFTAAYVTAFEQMREHIQQAEMSEIEQRKAEAQLLSAKAQVADQLIKIWESAGVAQSEQLLRISEFYGLAAPKQMSSPRIYNAAMVALDLGLYTDTGDPHAAVVDAIVDALISNPKLVADYDEGRTFYISYKYHA